MRRLGLLAALVTACAAPPDPQRVADELIAAYHDDQLAPLLARFAAPPDEAHLRRKFAWIRERVGACGPPVPLWDHGPRSVRYRSTCERGGIEASITLDERGRVTDLRHGATGVPLEEPLASAIHRVVATLPWTDADVPPAVDQDVTRPWARALGRCAVERPWLLSHTGGLIHVRCVGGPAILRIKLQDDRLVQIHLIKPSARRDDPDAV